MLLYWIWFAQLSKIPAACKQLLLQHFHDPEEIYHTHTKVLAKVDGVTQVVLEALEDKDLSGAKKILNDCTQKGIGLLTMRDAAYPERLHHIFDAPVLLYFKGKLPQWDKQPVLGIVGTRKATPYGMSTAARFGKEIAACGGLVISGCATGIDKMAMLGALDAGKPVVGVLGSGVDVVYPVENRSLFAEIIEQGCLLSEYPPGAQALGWHFLERNRIITGISNGLLVVEAPKRSGALNSARHAWEQGRDLFAVPGNVGVAACAGSNALLQDRATAALCGWDVIREYELLWPDVVKRADLRYIGAERSNLQVAQTPVLPENPTKTDPKPEKKAIDKDEESTYSVLNSEQAALSEAERAVFALICREPKTVDEIMEQADMPAGTVKSILTKLAIKRLTVNHPGGRVSLK